ncbi:MAG: plasmid pRiA4b ORF-3 family protein [Solobacterium sp.]|nr:plasmid pRiA4b ORF-3 family protein [Solobacterium sp.]
MKALQLKITIKGTKPPVWRTVNVPAAATFTDLDRIIRTVFAWKGDHLSMFQFKGWDITILPACSDELDKDEVDGREYAIESFFMMHEKISYIYDFGDYWEHEIRVMDFVDDYPEDYPKMVRFRGSNFPEDCGGVWGVEYLKSTLENPADPDYEKVLEIYDPAVYVMDRDQVNAALADIHCQPGHKSIMDLMFHY